MTQNKFAVIALTNTGCVLARQISKQYNADTTVIVPEKFAQDGETHFGRGQFEETFIQSFKKFDCLICIMATGIVVRSVSKVLADKLTDPAVIVIDERAHHVISLLSGHVGGANAWTKQLAEQLASDPVITTATDTEGVQALDVLAKEYHGWYAEFKDTTKQINGRLAAHQPVEIFIEPYLKDARISLAGFTEIDSVSARHPDVPLIIVSDRTHFDKSANSHQLIPRVNVLGIGCRKNVTVGMMQDAFSAFCQERELAWQSVAKIGSINIKAHEAAIHYLGQVLGLTPEFFTATNLSTVAGHYAQSLFVQKTVGVGNVAESASEYTSGQRVIGSRFVKDEITFALSRETIREN